MSLRAALLRSCLLATLLALPACGDPDQAYPRLLPLSDLTAPPEIPAHAADAAADPEAVGAGLRARRAKAQAAGARGPVTDAAALEARAAALRDRAEALSRAETSGRAATTLAPAGSAEPADPATAARAEALRQRARQMLDDGAGAAPALPSCPPGTPNPEAAGCTPR